MQKELSKQIFTPAELSILKKDGWLENIKVFSTLLTKIRELQNAIEEVRKQQGPAGIDGEPGLSPIPPTTDELLSLIRPLITTKSEILSFIEDNLPPEVTEEQLVSLIEPLIPEAPPAIILSEEDLIPIISKLIPKPIALPKIDLKIIAEKAAKLIKPPKSGKNAVIDYDKLIEEIKKNKLSADHIDGLDKMVEVITSRNKRYTHGGGDTLKAGTGYTIIRNSDGTVSLSIIGAGGTNVYEEVPTGSGTSFSLAHTPISGTLRLYRGGSRQKLTDDYSITGANITLSISLASGEVLVADYAY